MGFGASTTAQTLHSAPSSDPGFQPTSKIGADMFVGNGLMTDPYPHPQHMKVVKHLIYIQGGVTDLALHHRNYLPSPVTGLEGRSFV